MNEFPYPKPPPAPAGERRNVFSWFFSPFGRIGRVGYVLRLLPLFLAALVLLSLGLAALVLYASLAGFALLTLAGLVPLAGSVGVTMRRLHDVGVPGVLAVLAALPRVGWIVAFSQSTHDGSVMQRVAIGLLWGDMALAFVLAFWPGQARANADGEEPE